MKTFEVFTLFVCLAVARCQPTPDKDNQLDTKNTHQAPKQNGLETAGNHPQKSYIAPLQYQLNRIGEAFNNQDVHLSQHSQLQSSQFNNMDQSSRFQDQRQDLQFHDQNQASQFHDQNQASRYHDQNQASQFHHQDPSQQIYEQDLSEQFRNQNQQLHNTNQAIQSHNQLKSQQTIYDQAQQLENQNQAMQSHNQLKSQQTIYDQAQHLENQNQAMQSHNQLKSQQSIYNQAQQLENQNQTMQSHNQLKSPQTIYNQAQQLENQNRAQQFLGQNRAQQYHNQGPMITESPTRHTEQAISNLLQTQQQGMTPTADSMIHPQSKEHARDFSVRQELIPGSFRAQKDFYSPLNTPDQQNENRLLGGISSQLFEGLRSTNIKFSGLPRSYSTVSAFEKGMQPIVLPRVSHAQTTSVVVSGLKNLPSLPSLVYSAGAVPVSGQQVVAYSRPWHQGGAYIQQHWQSPYARYVYSNIL